MEIVLLGIICVLCFIIFVLNDNSKQGKVKNITKNYYINVDGPVTAYLDVGTSKKIVNKELDQKMFDVKMVEPVNVNTKKALKAYTSCQDLQETEWSRYT